MNQFYLDLQEHMRDDFRRQKVRQNPRFVEEIVRDFVEHFRNVRREVMYRTPTTNPSTNFPSERFCARQNSPNLKILI